MISLIEKFNTLLSRLPYSLIALIARFSMAAVFWKSGQTKVTGLVIDIVNGDFVLAWPKLSDSAVALFQSEYQLTFITADIAAPLAAFAEHAFPILLLLGLATRCSALALLGMTLVIQVFVYPDAYPIHGTWAALLLVLMTKGPGKFSLDHAIQTYFSNRKQSS